MLNAADARELVKKHPVEKAYRELDRVMDQIETYAKIGKERIWWESKDPEIFAYVVQNLKEMKYSIKRPNNERMEIEVSW